VIKIRLVADLAYASTPKTERREYTYLSFAKKRGDIRPDLLMSV
jgi:hypothetical protein